MQGGIQTGWLIGITGNNLRTPIGQRARLIRIRVPRDGADGKRSGRIGQNGVDEAAALRAGGSNYCDDFFVRRHVFAIAQRSGGLALTSARHSGVITSRPRMYGRNASGTRTEPSACW